MPNERGRELQAGRPAEEKIQLPARDTRNIDKSHAKHAQDVQRGRELRQSHAREADHDRQSATGRWPSIAIIRGEQIEEMSTVRGQSGKAGSRRVSPFGWVVLRLD